MQAPRVLFLALSLSSYCCKLVLGYEVTVVGGTGFVGSRVCQQLVAKGASVTSVSKSGKVPSWCADAPWTNDVQWLQADLEADDTTTTNTADSVIGSPEAMVSCVGVVGTDPDQLLRGNGMTNVNAFGAAKRGGKLKRTALVSVSSEVAACQNVLPEYFSGYFEGKRRAEEAALDAVGVSDGAGRSSCTVVRPSFVYGGGEFGLLPPRVSVDYGSGVEELLSLGLFRFLADATPGLIKVALRPPSSVDAVAAACVAGVMGDLSSAADDDEKTNILEGADEINDATDFPKATGLTDALQWAKENIIKAVKVIQDKLEEAQKE